MLGHPCDLFCIAWLAWLSDLHKYVHEPEVDSGLCNAHVAGILGNLPQDNSPTSEWSEG